MKSAKNVSKQKIMTKKQYEAAMKKIRKMWDDVPPTSVKEFDNLVDKCEAYEKKHFKF